MDLRIPNRKLSLRLIIPLCLAAITLVACNGQAPAGVSPNVSQIPSAASDVAAASPNAGSKMEFTACSSPAALTPALTEGPYYTPNTPERNSLLEPGIPGTPLILEGYVLTSDCQPVANAWLDFWQADANGVYDNVGYHLRGHQYSDANGRYQLTTVVPGQYPGRTEHIHFKIQAPDGPIMTSQLFFPGSSSNDTDRIYDQALLLTLEEKGGTVYASYNFVISVP